MLPDNLGEIFNLAVECHNDGTTSQSGGSSRGVVVFHAAQSGQHFVLLGALHFVVLRTLVDVIDVAFLLAAQFRTSHLGGFDLSAN